MNRTGWVGAVSQVCKGVRKARLPHGALLVTAYGTNIRDGAYIRICSAWLH
jgi:hypothetical protein